MLLLCGCSQEASNPPEESESEASYYDIEFHYHLDKDHIDVEQGSSEGGKDAAY